MRKILLALPLASMLVLAGCSNSCFTPSDDCNTCALSTRATTTTVVNSTTPTITVAEYQALVSSKATVIPAAAVKETPAVIVTPVEVAKPVKKVVAPKKVAPEATEKAVESPKTSLGTVKTSTLPEGWAYVSEDELSGGSLDGMTVEQYYSQAAKTSKAKDI